MSHESAHVLFWDIMLSFVVVSEDLPIVSSVTNVVSHSFVILSLLFFSCTDGVASQAFNGLTAMYYLLEQKHHVRRLKKAESMKSQIRQNSSNLSKPETGSDTNENHKLQISAAQPAPSAPGQKNSAAIKLTSIEPLAPIMAAVPVEKPIKDDKNVPIKTFVPVTPYLQAPLILQQQQLQQQQNQRQAHNNMPSLGAYLRGGVELPQQVGNVSEPGHYGNNNQPTKPNVGSVVVPPLNLRTNKANTNNATSVGMAVATGSLLGSKPAALTSQTARGPAPSTSAAASHNEGNTSGYGHPYTARTPLPSDMPVEILERPNTRRSHLRSRGGEHAVELAPAQALAPGEGLDSMPPTRETAPQMPVRRPEPVATANPFPAADKGGATGEESPTAAMALLVISNKKPSSEHAVQGAPTSSVAATPVAPEAPKSSAGASSSGAFAGRRGKNITGATTNGPGTAPTSNPTSNVTPTAPEAPVQPAPPAGSRPQPRPAAPHSKPAGQPNLAPLAPIVAGPVISSAHAAITDPQE